MKNELVRELDYVDGACALISYTLLLKMSAAHRLDMTSSHRRDRFLTIAIIAMVGVLLSAFVVSWLWWRQSQPSITVPEYALIGPIVTGTTAYSVSAKIALQTGSADAEWAKKNNAALRSVLEAALLSLEPQQVHAPGGLLAVQTHLLGAIEQQLKTNKIEQLLLTDFILQSDV